MKIKKNTKNKTQRIQRKQEHAKDTKLKNFENQKEKNKRKTPNLKFLDLRHLLCEKLEGKNTKRHQT